MAEQRNLTEENVESLREHLESMKAENPDLEYRFFKQGEKEMNLDNIYKYHSPKDGQQEIYESIRAKAKELALLIQTKCPEGRERSVAFTHIESAVMWANASIARS